MKKATMATVKSFIRNNTDSLLISVSSRFDGMTDCVESTGNDSLTTALKTDNNISHTLGIQGAWFIGSSRDYIEPLNLAGFKGFHIFNSCGSFDIAVAE